MAGQFLTSESLLSFFTEVTPCTPPSDWARAVQGTMRRPRSWGRRAWPHFELERENARR